MRQIQTAAGAAVLALASVTAQAQMPEPRLAMDSGVYIGAGVGRAHSDANCGAVCDTKDMTWQGYVGYQFNRFFAIEGGY
jgi:hypothetical protein